MLDAIGEGFVTTATLFMVLLVVTFPGWAIGKLVARKTRTLRVPALLRRAALRWLLWAVSGVIALMATAVATRPAGSLTPEMRGVAVAVIVAGAGGALLVAFFIGWTATAARMAKRQAGVQLAQPDSAPVRYFGPPVATAPRTDVVADDGERRLGDVDEYVPASPTPGQN